RPILFIVGENAHSRGFSETAYAAADEPQEIYVVEGANHVDLYDDITKIPFDKIEDFLNGIFNN
ncbi:alpha/beta hydrolase, partial [Klebsiella pneumoniae]|uniref:alpha/beta hydrolase n=1 Tax=Klebsiella pneumoniae TaxID=573 RepID=UPI0034D5016D